jgi:hypothetical protein
VGSPILSALISLPASDAHEGRLKVDAQEHKDTINITPIAINPFLPCISINLLSRLSAFLSPHLQMLFPSPPFLFSETFSQVEFLKLETNRSTVSDYFKNRLDCQTEVPKARGASISRIHLRLNFGFRFSENAFNPSCPSG